MYERGLMAVLFVFEVYSITSGASIKAKVLNRAQSVFYYSLYKRLKYFFLYYSLHNLRDYPRTSPFNSYFMQCKNPKFQTRLHIIYIYT